MKSATYAAIKNAEDLGNFHVVCDQPNYIGDEWVGQGLYYASFNSKGVALVVAAKQDNGKVYNSDCKEITP